jgi:lipopolysaccharide transport system ATP-binding protein
VKDIILKAENISKQYRLGTVGTGTLSHDLNRWWHQIRGKEDPYLKIGDTNDRSTKGNSEYVWALQDINFEVERGEVLGIIGKNGAGKSTLLKILSKVTAPTTGSIKSRGRIASLLEVGTGFNPELTGKENIFLNGAILGMSKKEIASKLDEIVEFSGCERYIDTPVKRYSSGMTVRLAFAVAAFLEPEILVIDEVLAVGDAEFQKKAIGKMQDISKSEGRTVLFVSHNMAAVKQLCTRGIVMEQGKVVFNGYIDDALNQYLKMDFNETNIFTANKTDKLPFIKEIEVITSEKGYFHKFKSDLDVKIVLYTPEKLIEPALSYQIVTVDDNPIIHELNLFKEKAFCDQSGLFELVSTISSLSLYPGVYKINVFFADNFLKKKLDAVMSSCSFEILPDEKRDYYYSKGSAIYKEKSTKWEIRKIE